ncbi:MAG: peptidase M1 [Crocinitomicaceae bacterium]|nr:peptidase M1 [Crocinitomicaceae bacterium]|tara:strand:+ start:6709 stop:8658 length:1950 start_codon:yes stop_codon:yes gene_type:complete
MSLRVLILAAFLILSGYIFAQAVGDVREISEAEAKAFQYAFSRGENNESGIGDRTYFDVEKQEIVVDVDPTVKSVKGKVTTTFKVLKSGHKSILLDLSNKLVLDSIQSASGNISWKHEDGFVDIQFANELTANQSNSITLFYRGNPDGGRAFSIDTTTAGSPVLWTLSEPYGAKEWWPCKQDLQDKIEKLVVTVRNPMQYKAVANGIKQSEQVVGGIRETRFEHNYPIVSYLVAFAVADYREIRDTLDYNGKKMPFVNYVYPASEAQAKKDLVNFDKTLALFDSLFGEYPFANELYGHAQFTWGGGMEHQTMSFMYNFDHGLVAHELAHQWFGDQVTCGSWQDLWLNEGFATYAAGLTYEFLFFDNSWLNWRQNTLNEVLKNTDGSVFIEDTTDVRRMFNPRLTYQKGAYLLHMLRYKIGDEAFFKAIRTYLWDPKLSYGFAKTENLKHHLKLAGGEDIDEFFDDWYYRKGWPSYQIDWYQDQSNKLYLVVNQEQSYIWEGTYFRMDLPILISGNGLDTTLRLENIRPNQEYIIQLDKEIIGVNFDPDLWLISGNNTVEQVDYKHELIGYKIAPNPVKNELVVFSSSPNLPLSNMEIYNVEGKVVWKGRVDQGLSSSGFKISLEKLNPGIYFLRVSDFYSTSLLKFVKM